jgi:hypothetical protein
MIGRLLALLFPSLIAAGAVVAACSSAPAQGGGDGGGTGEACVVAIPCDDFTGFMTGSACTPCDGGAPSYKTEIAPILEEGCTTCHGPGGVASNNPENTYADIQGGQAGPMLDQVNTCTMPPINGPVFTNAQRVALTAWLRCGAPNN